MDADLDHAGARGRGLHAQRPPPVAPTTATPAVTLAPSPIATSQIGHDPALAAAVHFEQRHCAWTWRRPLTAYVAAQRSLATTEFGRQLAAAADPGSWHREVILGRQVVTCSVTAAHRLVGAPSTSTSVYTRLAVAEHVTSTMGSFAGGERLASLRVQLVDGRWLVAGPYTGG